MNPQPLIDLINQLPLDQKDKNLCLKELARDPSQDTIKQVLGYLYVLSLEKDALADHLQTESQFYKNMAIALKKIHHRLTTTPHPLTPNSPTIQL